MKNLLKRQEVPLRRAQVLVWCVETLQNFQNHEDLILNLFIKLKRSVFSAHSCEPFFNWNNPVEMTTFVTSYAFLKSIFLEMQYFRIKDNRLTLS